MIDPLIFQEREPVDHGIHRAVNGLDGILCLGDFALDLAARGAIQPAGPQVLDMNQKLGHTALDRAELVEPGVGSVELCGERDDPVFEIAERELLAARQLVALHAVGHAVEQRFDARRQRRAAGGVFELFGQRRDLFFQRRHVGAARHRGAGHALDFRGQAAHLVGEHGELIVRGDMRDDAAQCRDRGFELLHEIGIVARRPHLLDLERQAADRIFESGEAFGRFQFAQGLVHVDQAVLHIAEDGRIDAVFAAFVDALGDVAHFVLQRLNRAPGHRFGELAADLVQLTAQSRDLFVDFRLVQPLHHFRDGAELVFKSGEILRREMRRGLCCRRIVSRCGVRGGSGRRRRCGVSLRHLPRRHARRRRCIRRHERRGMIRRRRRVSRWRRIGRRGWRRVMLLLRHQRRIERMLARGNLSHCLFDGRGPWAALTLRVRLRRRRCIGRSGRRGVRRRWREGARVGLEDHFARLHRRGDGFFREDLAEALVEPVDALGQARAFGGALVVVIVVMIAVGIIGMGLMRDDVIEPFADRHTGAARGLPGAVTHLGPHAFYVPRYAKFHALTRIQVGRGGAVSRTA